MKKKLKLTITLIASLLALPLTVGSAEDQEQIVVQLPTECRLLPLYMEEVEDASSGLSASYLKKLEEVLGFDLNHNGMTYCVKRNPSNVKVTLDSATYPKICRDMNVYYLIKTQVKDKKLAVRMYSANNKSVKGIDGLLLTGDIKKDRLQMHHVADVIHKELFGKPGIASTHFLYTVRNKIPGQNNWASEVWEADYDGGNARQLTRGGEYCITPSYIPPHKGHASGSFFYVSYKSGQPKVFLASLHDEKTQRFSFLKGNQLMPAINRQRDHVAFISDATGNPDLFLQTFSPEEGSVGKPQQIFTSYLATQGSPCFSPDGKKIAFVSNKDGSPRIYLMEVPPMGQKMKKVQPQLLTRYNHESTAPAWSPDGTKIAYCARTEGVRQIWVYDFNRNEERQLTSGPGNKENPTWAPNSLHLIFNSSDSNASELYLINLNQPSAVKISSGQGEKRFPNWEPRSDV